jgi:hypothetical protein
MGVKAKQEILSSFERRALVLGLILTAFLAIGPLPAQGQENDESNGEQSYAVRPAKPHASQQLPQSLMGALGSQGFRLYGTIGGTKTLICEIFWAAAITVPDQATASSNLLYSRLKPGTLIGVIHFFIIQRYVRDYRSQMLKPGYYTLRYAPMAEGDDGSQLDFVLLSPVREDRSPSQVPTLDELVRRGRLSSRTKRPAMMSLVEADKNQSFPSLVTDDEGTCTLQVKLPVKPAKSTRSGPPAELPIALILVTAIPEDLGD